MPRAFMLKILKLCPPLEQIFNLVLCLEDATIQDDFIVKDISLLLGNRNLEDIFVVDTDRD